MDAAHYRSLRFEIRFSTACRVAAFAAQLVALLSHVLADAEVMEDS
jgi:hypothetical protein